MEALIAATLTATGSLVMAALQARTARKETELLQGQWEVKPAIWLPNLRRDKAHQNLAPTSVVAAKTPSRKKVHLSFPLVSAESDSAADWNEEASIEKDDLRIPLKDPAANSEKMPAEKVPLESLKFGPCLLDSTTFTVWGVLLGAFLVAGLVGPQINANYTQFNVLLIPLVTLALAATYPLPWAWATLVVGCLQGASCLGYWMAGESFQPGDGNFLVAMYFINALAVALVSAFAMQRHRQMIVMKPA